MTAFQGRQISNTELGRVIASYEKRGYTVVKIPSATGTSDYGVYRFSSLITLLFVT